MDMSFTELREKVEECRRCHLYKTRNRVVFGEGPVPAPILLVGEGPGADEDRIGRPFVGKAGQLLDKILAACNFNRQKHVYIGNIVKCRPPQNRAPEPEEIRECLPYLEKQLEFIKPQIIVPMGATAIKGLLGGTPRITNERGRWQLWRDYHMMPVFHPAALLRNPNLKRDTWEDFKNIIRKYRKLVDADHYCEYV